MNIELFSLKVKTAVRAAALAGVLVPALVAVASLAAAGCSDTGAPPSAGPDRTVASDADLFRHITESSPFVDYSLFPGVDSIASGALNGSTAHQPTVRVSINDKGLGSLVADTLPAAGSFAAGSVIVKEIRVAGETTLLAVLVKVPGNPHAAEGWLWAEYRPDGAVVFSITRRGDGCVPCHSREQGPRNDFVRTFERRRP